MSMLLRYLREEGLAVTLHKVAQKFFRKESVTVVLKCGDLPQDVVAQGDIRFVSLSEEQRDEFERIKFFEHVRAEDYIGHNNREIVLIYKDDVCVGYAAAEYEQIKKIHGLGTFALHEKEAWLGPVYVRKAYRGQGLNASACRFLMAKMHSRGILCCYTAINQNNQKSLRSFAKAGFAEIGNVVVVADKTVSINCEICVAEHFREK